jgi:hypothetical protein
MTYGIRKLISLKSENSLDCNYTPRYERLWGMAVPVKLIWEECKGSCLLEDSRIGTEWGFIGKTLC